MYLVRKGERRVEKVAVRRLIPVPELKALVERLDGLGQGVCALDVAEHFECPEEEARQALELLALDGYRKSA